ncbi:MAG: alpha/beta hydrolase, partial [Bacteroidaceae bacterium]|nr:alpha/beta hydrolase [Bacteroidaceae bacterium]
MKKILISSLICICLLVVLLVGASFYMVDYALARRHTTWTEEKAWQRVEEYYPWTMEWTDSIRANGVLNDTFILAEDGRRLHGYYLPRHPKHDSVDVARTALLIHGYRNCAIDMMHLGYMYHHSMGCNIVLPDLHAHGQSDGESIQMGWKD